MIQKPNEIMILRSNYQIHSKIGFIIWNSLNRFILDIFRRGKLIGIKNQELIQDICFLGYTYENFTRVQVIEHGKYKLASPRNSFKSEIVHENAPAISKLENLVYSMLIQEDKQTRTGYVS